MKYRKKPVVIDAVKWDGHNYDEVSRFTGIMYYPIGAGGILIDTLEGKMTASIGDYIIKGVNGEFYPCKPDIFAKTYEEVIGG